MSKLRAQAHAHFLAWLPLLLLTGCLDGPADAPDLSASVERLRATFPEQAARVLESDRAFVRGGDGFALGEAGGSPGAPRAIHLRLPRRGEARITVRAGAELYDPGANAWSSAAPMPAARRAHTATALANGLILVAGGRNPGGALTSAVLYDPGADAWSPAASMATGRSAHSAARLADGKVLVAGGLSGSNALASAELYGFNALGEPCASPGDCVSGFCADGVCCNTACTAGPCDACSMSAGASVNGTCALLTGPACDDGDACTQTDACQAGACTPGLPVACPPADECHLAGTCAPATGACSTPAKPDGTPCSLGFCQSGVCEISPSTTSSSSSSSGTGGSGGGSGVSSSSSSGAGGSGGSGGTAGAGGHGGSGGDATTTTGMGGGGAGASSSSSSGSGGAPPTSSSSGDAPPEDASGESDGGCGCRAAGSGSDAPRGALAVSFAAWALAFRRRRRPAKLS